MVFGGGLSVVGRVWWVVCGGSCVVGQCLLKVLNHNVVWWVVCGGAVQVAMADHTREAFGTSRWAVGQFIVIACW